MRKLFHFFCFVVLFLATSQLNATSFDVVNTGSNMTVFVTPGATMSGDLAQVDQVGIFYTDSNLVQKCAGVSSFDAAGGFQITLWGSEANADNGMANDETLTWKARSSGGAIYDVTASYINGAGVYTLNNILYVNSLTFDLDESTVVEGCVDSNADNYSAEATYQNYDEYGNIKCNYSSCDDIPDTEGCMYAANYAALRSDFTAAQCESYGGTACIQEVLGCIDENATNYDSAANTQSTNSNGMSSCKYDSCEDVPDEVGCLYITTSYRVINDDFTAEDCNGTVCSKVVVPATVNVTFQVDMSAVETHEDGVYLAGGGFGQDGHLMTDNGSDVWTVTLELDTAKQHLYKFRNQPSFGTWDGFEDKTHLISGGCSTGEYSDRFVDVAQSDIVLDVVAYGSCTAEAPVISGCTNESASNYNEDASVDDGSCITLATSPAPTAAADEVLSVFSDAYTSTAGVNYNPDWGQATQVSVSDVIHYAGLNYQGTSFDAVDVSGYGYLHVDYYVVSSTALNFFLIGGGETSVSLDLSTTGEWVSIDIPLTDYSGSVDLTAVHQFKVDGNGEVYFDNLYFGGTPPAVINGCTDATAINYNDEATDDDGSCIASAPAPTAAADGVLSVFGATYGNLEGTDFNPGWGQATQVTVDDVLTYKGLNYQGTQFPNQDVSGYGYIHVDYYTTNSTALNFFLISPGKETPVALDVTNTGVWNSVDIPLSDYASVVDLTDVFQFKVDGNGDVVIGNLYFGGTPPTISGCTDATALNYNAAANESDDSCTYPDPCADLVTHFNIEAEAASAMYLKVQRTGANTVDVSAVSATNDPMDLLAIHALPAGATASEAVIVDGTATVTLTWADGAPATSTFEVHWSKVTMGGNWLLRTSDQPEINTADACGGTLSGCTDAAATNYWALATEDDGSCQLLVSGCTDVAATNYDAAATTDDGTCTYPSKVNVTFQVDMSNVDTHAEGVYIAGGGFGQAGHLLTDNGSDVWSVTLELDPNAQYLYKFRNQPSYGTWDGFEDPAGLIDGACNTGQYNDRYVDVAEEDIVLDVVAYGSCTADAPPVLGCTDESADNYNAAATKDDGSCVTVSIPDAPVPTEAAEDVLSIFSNAYTNVEGTDFNPNWGQGTVVTVTDVLTYSGLNYQGTQFPGQDVSGYGYVNVDFYTEDATEFSFTIISPGQEKLIPLTVTLNQWNSVQIPLTDYPNVNLADVFQFKVTGNGTVNLDNLYFGGTPPTVSGCTDATALNYNAAATEDDGSCQLPVPGCTDAAAFNYDSSATTDDGSCVAVVNGCTDATATNHNPAANTDDNSCTYPVDTTLAVFSGAFAGATVVDDVYTFPSDADSWAGFANENSSLYPLSFPYGATLTFNAAAVDSDVDVRFRFEANPYPNTEPSFNTSVVTVSGAETSYSIEIPSQGDNTFNSYLLFLDTRDAGVVVKDVKVTENEAPPVVPGCTDATAFNYNADANEDNGTCIARAADPTLAASDVLSIFGDTYGNLEGTNFNPGWGQATAVVVGDELKYSNLNYQGTEFTNQDVSAYTYLNVDYYTDNSSDLGIYLISPGSETEYVFGVNQGEWNSVKIPLTAFSTVVDLTNVFQFKVEGNGDVYFDNLYFGGVSTSDSDGDGVADGQDPAPLNPDFSDASIAAFTQTFGGATIGEGYVYEKPEGASWWAGFRNENSLLHPIDLSVPTVLTFTASIATEGVDSAAVRFKFENEAHPNNHVIYDADAVVVGSAEATYSISIPAQGNTEFNSLLMYVRTWDAAVAVKDVKIEVPNLAPGCTDETAVNYSAAAEIDDDSCVESLTPTLGADSVLSIFGDSYSNVANTNFNPGWGQQTAVTVDNFLTYTGLNYQGTQFDDVLDVTDYHFINIDYYTENASSLKFFLISIDDENGTRDGNRETLSTSDKGVWNSVQIPLSEFTQWSSSATNLSSIAQFKIEGNGTIVFDNIYFGKEPTVLGCTTGWAINFNPDANEDDGSCQIEGCTDTLALNHYDSDANVDDGSCEFSQAYVDSVIAAAVAAVDITSDNQAVADQSYGWGYGDGVASVDITSDNQAVADAAYADGAASVTCEGNGNGNGNNQEEVFGCTKRKAINYDSSATVNDGSCVMAKRGCTNPEAVNYNPNANVDNGNCVVKTAGCTNPNAINFDPSANKNDGSCIRAISGCTDVNARNYNPNANVDNGSCIGAVYGCMFDFGFVTNYNPSANINQISASDSGDPCNYSFGRTLSSRNRSLTQVCVDPLANNYFPAADSNSSSYDENVASNVAVDNSVCEYSYGCTDATAFNYDVSATVDDGSCVAEVVGCMDASYVEYDASANVSNSNLCITVAVLGCIDVNATNYDADATVQSQDQYANSTCIYDSCEDIPDASGCIYDNAYAALRSDFTAENCSTYGGTPCEEVIVGCTDSDADNYNVNATDDDGSCVYVVAYSEASEALIAALANQEDGVTQADVDAAFASGVASVDITTDNQAAQDEAYGWGYGDGVASVTPEDGVTQADVDSVQALLDEALANGGGSGGGSCDPIEIDIVAGWNILGYTLSYGQDVAATVASIVDDIEIVKNNDAKVYWPEFGFNGIGDFVPGQGYQVKTTAAISSYTWPDVSGQRIEMTPTVPAWAIEMEAELHPNDIRSLVKVVNMLGQEVNPKDQFSGEVLLHLFNDGTVEKRIVK